MKFLDLDGLTYFWQKIKAIFVKNVSISGSTLTVTKGDDTNSTYTVATKVNNVSPDSTGNISITTVSAATKATQDGNGNTITTTYATKTELSQKADTSQLANYATTTQLNAKIQAGTTDLTAGTSNLATGTIYCVYE